MTNFEKVLVRARIREENWQIIHYLGRLPATGQTVKLMYEDDEGHVRVCLSKYNKKFEPIDAPGYSKRRLIAWQPLKYSTRIKNG